MNLLFTLEGLATKRYETQKNSGFLEIATIANSDFPDM